MEIRSTALFSEWSLLRGTNLPDADPQVGFPLREPMTTPHADVRVAVAGSCPHLRQNLLPGRSRAAHSRAAELAQSPAAEQAQSPAAEPVQNPAAVRAVAPDEHAAPHDAATRFQARNRTAQSPGAIRLGTVAGPRYRSHHPQTRLDCHPGRHYSGHPGPCRHHGRRHPDGDDGHLGVSVQCVRRVHPRDG